MLQLRATVLEGPHLRMGWDRLLTLYCLFCEVFCAALLSLKFYL